MEEDTQTKKELNTKRDFQPKKKKEVIPMSDHDSFVCANSISVRYDEIWNKKERSLKKEPLFES